MPPIVGMPPRRRAGRHGHPERVGRGAWSGRKSGATIVPLNKNRPDKVAARWNTLLAKRSERLQFPTTACPCTSRHSKCGQPPERGETLGRTDAASYENFELRFRHEARRQSIKRRTSDACSTSEFVQGHEHSNNNPRTSKAEVSKPCLPQHFRPKRPDPRQGRSASSTTRQAVRDVASGARASGGGAAKRRRCRERARDASRRGGRGARASHAETTNKTRATDERWR